ncbi:hypothetical protein BH18ACT2_BH18ACT2_25030 [soil metagenome]
MSWDLGRNVAGVAISLGLVALAASCGSDTPAASTNSVTINPSTYRVIDPVTTSTVPEDTGPDADGRSLVEQEYIVQEGDYPIAIADLYDVDVEELRNYNGWDEEFDGFPDAGGEVRIPPDALFVDPSDITTTTDEPVRTPPSTDETGENGDTGEPEVTPEPTEVDPQDCVPITYTVEVGDNPTLIAQKFDVTLEALTAANGWDAEYSNFPDAGETITIPPAPSCTPG